jgi:exodeoxyribonuclease VII large subunit
LIGEVQVRELTLREFEARVQERLQEGYLVDPRVSAEVTNYRPFYITGDVNSPGRIPYSEGLTVQNAVALAGGYTVWADQRRVLTVSQFTSEVRRTLETAFPMIWVEGELSNLSRPGSGHWYFTLKDDRAQVRCAMFANRNRAVRFRPTDGLQVLLRGRVSLYEPRGDFQLIAEHLEPAGEGALRAAFEALKVKLDAEGLFAVEAKRTLPPWPKRIAVITSPSGAAVRDVLAVLGRRCPATDVVLLPVAVQGRDAEPQIGRAFARLADWETTALGPRPDVVLLVRGGGSLEDLWAFNLESVARAIAACTIPVVVGVGHETDVTIADFVADLRAPTPSAAAEQVAPDVADCLGRLMRGRQALQTQMDFRLRSARQHVDHWAYRLVHPGRALQQQMQRVDDYERQLHQCMRRALDVRANRLALQQLRLAQRHPRHLIDDARRDLAQHAAALRRSVAHRLERHRAALQGVARALQAVSPLDTVSRGYAIVMQPPRDGARWGTPITSIASAQPRDRIIARLRDGDLHCTIDEVTPDDD